MPIMESLVKRMSSLYGSSRKKQGDSTIKTSVIILTGCVVLVCLTILPQSFTGNSTKELHDNLIKSLSDHSLVVLNELVDMDVDFTFFAPTRKALGKKLNSATEDSVTSFFEGHIVYNERLFTSSVKPGKGLVTTAANGSKLFLEVKKKKLLVQGVPVVTDNILVGPRGVVHIIKGVLEETERPSPSKFPKKILGGSEGNQAAKQGGGAQGKDKGTKASATRSSKVPAARKAPVVKKNPFDVLDPFKYRNLLECSGHGFVDTKGGGCVCASLYTGNKCSEVRTITFKRIPGQNSQALKRIYKRIVGHSPIVLNKKKFKEMDEVMVRTRAKTLGMIPKVTPDVRKSIMEVLPEDDPFHGRVFNVCSLVGSSGSLLYFENGPAIDESDLVIRFNHAPIKMFEKFVGSRTDLRISNGEHLGFNEKPNEKTLHHLRSKSFLTRILLYEKKFGKAKLPYLVNPGFTEYVANASLPYIASSGYFAILMAMEVCSHVHLYGFHSSFNQGSRHHYFNAEVPSNPKRDTSEYERLKHLEDLGFLKFAEPCLHECYGSSSDCEACFGEPMYKVTAKQKLSRAQIKLAEDREKERLQFRQWEGPLKRQWEFSDKEGLIKKTGDSRRRRRRGRRSGGRSRGGRRNRRSGGRSRGHSTNMSVNIHLATERARAAVGATQKPES